jgi:hypothetical protein
MKNGGGIPKAQDGTTEDERSLAYKTSNKTKVKMPNASKINKDIKETKEEKEREREDWEEFLSTGFIKHPRSKKHKKAKEEGEKKQTYLTQAKYNPLEKYDQEKAQAIEDKKQFKKNVIAPLDVTTDIMQLGNFVPNPIAQTIGGIGNIAGSALDAYQAYDALSEGNYTDAAINAGSVFLPMALGSQTFRRNSKYLQPGQPLYSLSPQANLPFGTMNIPRVSYIEPFTKVKGMTDASLFANRALLGTLGAETMYDTFGGSSESSDAPKQKNGGWLENYNDSQASAPEGMVGDGFSNVGRDYSPAWGGQFKDGGKAPGKKKKPIYVESKNDPRYKAYNDSLTLYNNNLKDLSKNNALTYSNKYDAKLFDFLKFGKHEIKPKKSVKKHYVGKPNPILNSLYKEDPNDKMKTEDVTNYMDAQGNYIYDIDPISADVIINSYGKHAVKGTDVSFNFPWEDDILKRRVAFRFKKPQQPVIVKPTTTKETTKPKSDKSKPDKKRDKVTPIQNNIQPEGIESNFNIETSLPVIRPEARMPKSFDVSSQRQTMSGPSEYYDYSGEGVDINDAIRAKESADAYNQYIQEKYKEAAKSNPKAQKRLEQLMQKVELTPNFQIGGNVYPVNYVPQAAMGASMPGAVGFTYARTQGIPSEGPYAKKTMASAQEGTQIKENNDWLANWYANRKIPNEQLQSLYEEDKPYYLERLKNIPEVTNVDLIGDDPNITGSYKTDTNQILVTPQARDNVYLHEANHYLNNFPSAMRTVHGNITSANIAPKENLTGVYKDKYDYFSNPDEVHSRIQVLRKKANLQPDEEVTPERLNKFLKTYKGDDENINDLLNLSDTDHLLEMLNYMAYNEPSDISSIAQNGKEMSYYQNGLDWKPKGMKNGGWLDAYDKAQEGERVLPNNNRALQILANIQKRKQKGEPSPQFSNVKIKDERGEAVTKVDNTRTAPKLKVTDVKKLNVRNKTEAELAEQERISDEAIAAERKAIREKADANPLNQGLGFFDSKNQTRQNWEDSTAGLESKFRVSDEPNFFDDWINPASWVGRMAANLGAAPNQIVQQDSMMPLISAIAEPVVSGAIGPIVGPYISKAVKPIKKAVAKGVLPILEGAQSINNKVNNKVFDLISSYRANNKNIMQKSIEAANAGNAWTREWYSNPEIQTRYNEWITPGNKFIDPKTALFHSNIENMYPGMSSINLDKSFANKLSGTIARNNLEKLLVEGKFTNPVTDGLGSRSIVGRYSHGLNDALVDITHPGFNKRMFFGKGYDVGNTFVHENTHAITKGDYGFKPEYLQKFKDPFSRTAEEIAKKQLTKHQKYLVKPTEVHARINELRRTFGLSPETVVDDKLMDHIIKQGLKGKTSVEKDFFKLIKDKTKFKELMNTAPAGAIGVGLGAGALQQQREGGVIKDDRGQWDHPGEITEIGSNQITMEGVPYPVLGISDTGDTKLMKPGKDYKFKGKKVTEFPMAQRGVDLTKKNFKTQVNNVGKFMLSYYNSPKFKERAMNSGYGKKTIEDDPTIIELNKEKDPNFKYVEPFIKERENRKQAVKNARFHLNLKDQGQALDEEGDITSSYSDMFDNKTKKKIDKIVLNPLTDRYLYENDGGYDLTGINLQDMRESTIAHELSHNIQSYSGGDGGWRDDRGEIGLGGLNKKEYIDLLKNNLSLYRLKDETRNYLIDKVNKSEDSFSRGMYSDVLDHDDRPEEMKADIDALRFELFKDKIYDARTQDFKQEHLDKAKNSLRKQRLQKHYTDEDLIYLMNTIAQQEKENKDSEYQVAKNGIRQEQKGLVNLDNLLNFTNYNKPQPGGWLNKYN